MVSTAQNTKNRMMLLLIAGIPLIIVLAASWLWYFVVRGDLDLVSALGTANRGDLVQPPRAFADATLIDNRGREFQHADLDPRWTLLVPASGESCGEVCESTLYTTRQIHVAMGKGFNRIRRYYVSDHAAADTRLAVQRLSDDIPVSGDFSEYLDSQHRGMRVLQIPAEDFQRQFPEFATAPDTWYLVDPAGWIMMSYDAQIPYKDVISDLKFLLKNSSE